MLPNIKKYIKYFIDINKKFIIIIGNNIKIINPIKDKFEYKYENIKNIINYVKNFGSWRVLIKEESHD